MAKRRSTHQPKAPWYAEPGQPTLLTELITLRDYGVGVFADRNVTSMPVLLELAARYEPEASSFAAMTHLLETAVESLPTVELRRAARYVFGLEMRFESSAKRRSHAAEEIAHVSEKTWRSSPRMERQLLIETAGVLDRLAEVDEDLPPLPSGATPYVPRAVLDDALKSVTFGDGTSRLAFLTGEPGAGKSRALMHALADQPEVTWLRAYSPEALCLAVANLSGPGDLGLSNFGHLVVIHSLIDRAKSSSVVVLDGLYDLSQLEHLLPTHFECTVWITSLTDQTPRAHITLDCDAMSLKEAGLLAASVCPSLNEAQAEELGYALGGRPRLIEQAAAVIESGDSQLELVLEACRSDLQLTMDALLDPGGHHPLFQFYEGLVGAVADDQACGRALMCIGFGGHGNLTERVLRSYIAGSIEGEPSAASRLETRRTLNRLRAHHLISVESGFIRMDPVTMRVCRIIGRRTLRGFMRLAINVFVNNEAENINRCTVVSDQQLVDLGWIDEDIAAFYLCRQLIMGRTRLAAFLENSEHLAMPDVGDLPAEMGPGMWQMIILMQGFWRHPPEGATPDFAKILRASARGRDLDLSELVSRMGTWVGLRDQWILMNSQQNNDEFHEMLGKAFLQEPLSSSQIDEALAQKEWKRDVRPKDDAFWRAVLMWDDWISAFGTEFREATPSLRLAAAKRVARSLVPRQRTS